MKKGLLIIIALATLAILASSCSKSSYSKKCKCDNWEEGRILNSFTTTTEEYGVSECSNISGIVYYNGKNGLECYDK